MEQGIKFLGVVCSFDLASPPLAAPPGTPNCTVTEIYSLVSVVRFGNLISMNEQVITSTKSEKFKQNNMFSRNYRKR
jgi:hypothetical protein